MAEPGNPISDNDFEKWIRGFQADFSLRQKERIAKLAYLRCREYYDGNLVMKVQLRDGDLWDGCENEPQR